MLLMMQLLLLIMPTTESSQLGLRRDLYLSTKANFFLFFHSWAHKIAGLAAYWEEAYCRVCTWTEGMAHPRSWMMAGRRM
jgi:hypothetical protein